MVNMDVIYVRDLKGPEMAYRGGHTPAGKAGDVVNVEFALGAKLIAAGFAVAVEDEDSEPEDE